MRSILSMPPAGFIVIVVIGILFLLALGLLFYLFVRYRSLTSKAAGNPAEAWGFTSQVVREYSAAYKQYGQDVNTPAIITNTIASRLGGLLLGERFLNNSVSLFVTLGLFGTFLGLSLSVSSLTELLSYSNGVEWLSVLDSIGGGLLSALSGMGVAFYTSLVGAGCSILLTVMRTIFNPQAEREKLETRLELWLDTQVAPTLETQAVKDDVQLVQYISSALNQVVKEMKSTMGEAGKAYGEATRSAAEAYAHAVAVNQQELQKFDGTVEKFNAGIHEFSEVDYNLRGSVERMDLAVRDLSAAMREINRRMEGGKA